MSYFEALLNADAKRRAQQRAAERKAKQRARDVFSVADFDAALFEHDDSEVTELREQRERYDIAH